MTSITGKDQGSIREDARKNFDSGVLHLQDNSDSFLSSTVQGIYGVFRMQGDGRWVYVLDNSLATTQSLDQGERGVDSFQIATANGGSDTVSIVVHGAADTVAASAAHFDADVQDLLTLVGVAGA